MDIVEGKKSPKEKPSFNCDSFELPEKTAYNNVSASVGKEIFLPVTSTPSFMSDDCGDSLFLKSGTVYRVKIFDENEDEIFYKRCANLQGPLLTANKSDIKKVRYQTGNEVIFKNPPKTKIDIDKVLTGKTKLPRDTSAKIGIFFAVVFMLAVFLFIISMVIASEILFTIGLIIGIISFLISFFASVYNLVQSKIEPEGHKGKPKAKLALFMILFGALVAIPFIVIYLKNNN